MSAIPVLHEGREVYSVRQARVADALDEATRRWPERRGWTFDDVGITFEEMRARSLRVARALLAHGIGRGDVVAAWTPNLPEAAYLRFGCARIGALVVHLNTRFKSFELEHILAHSDARLLVMVERMLRIDFNDILRDVLPDGDRDHEGRVASRAFPSLGRIVSFDAAPHSRSLSWQRFLQAADGVSDESLETAAAAVRWDDASLLQYTSGTTARPKGALLDHRYCLYASVERLVRAGLDGDGIFMNTQPYYHIGGAGTLTVPLTLGCEVVSTAYYDVERVLGLIEARRCTVRSGQSAMYVMELDHPRFREYDLSSLAGGWCIGPRALMQRVHDEMPLSALVQIYGTTEGGGTGGCRGDPWDLRASTCGRTLTGLELAIRDPRSGRELPPGSVGEIRSRGWQQMMGYLKQPAETTTAIDADGWLHLGDLGRVDAGGYLTFVGRLKDMLRVGGENLSAEEVESVLLGHPDVANAAVIGYPDRRLGEVVLAVIEPRAGSRLSADDIIDYSRARMANFRVPRQVRFVSDWPLTGSGKIQKGVLRERYCLPSRQA